MRRKIAIVVSMVAVMLVGLVGVANAATTGTVTPSATVQTVVSLTLTSPNWVTEGWNAIAPPFTETASVTANVKANKGWNLTVYKNNDLRNALASATIPSTQFTFQSTGPVGPTYVVTPTQFPLIAAPATVASSSTYTPNAGIDVSVNYSLVTNLSDAPDTYTATHTYTSAAP